MKQFSMVAACVVVSLASSAMHFAGTAEPGGDPSPRRDPPSAPALASETIDSGDARIRAASAIAAATASAPTPALRAGDRRIRGVVTLPRQSPAAEARVALFERKDDVPVGEATAWTMCDSRGAFELDVPRSSSECVVAVFRRGHLPWTRALELRETEDRELGRIELFEGASIEGRVLVAGKAVGGGRVVASLRHRGEAFHPRGGTLVWQSGRFAWADADARTDPDGRYRIVGLVPDAYDVRMPSSLHAEPIVGIGALGVTEARAPAKDVDFDLPAASLQVYCRFDGRPAPGVDLQLGREGWAHAAVTDQNGRARFLLVAGFEYELLAQKRGIHGPSRTIVNVAAAAREHEHVVELDPWPLATVSITVDSSSPEPVGKAGFFTQPTVMKARFLFQPIEASARAPGFTRLVPDKAARQAKHWRRRSTGNDLDADGSAIPEDVHVDIGPGEDRFDLLHVPSGRYRVVVQVGEALSNEVVDNPAHLFEHCDSEVVVDVPAAGTVRATTKVARRPRVVVVARSEEGVQLAAICRVRDADGRPLEPILVVENEDGWWCGERLDSKLPTQVYSRLCGGPCEIEIAHAGYRSRRIPVELATVDAEVLEVVLERE